MIKLLLVGAGESHLHILKQLRKNTLSGVEVTLLTPAQYQYSADMSAGFAEGLYSLDTIKMDVGKLADQAGVVWQKGAAMSVDPEQKMILTDEGALMTYDIVSFAIGTLTAGTEMPGVMEHGITIRPNYRIPEAIQQTQAAKQLAVVGGSAESVEMALALHTYRVAQDPSASTVLVSEKGIMQQYDNEFVRKAEKILRNKKMDIHQHTTVKKVRDNKILTDPERIIPFDALLWLASTKSQQLFINGGLPVDDHGYLLVEETLQVKSYPSVFAAGSCAALSKGRYAAGDIRQASVLWNNIQGFLGDGQGVEYQPSPSTYTIIATGGKTALCQYKGRLWHGKWPWKLKDLLDRRFVKKYR